jgi:cation-transporting ATPase 13A3/4/5
VSLVRAAHGADGDQIMHPFYVFQVFSFSIWFWEGYYYYAAAIVLITSISIVAELVSMRRHWLMLHRMAVLDVPVRVIRDGQCACHTSLSRARTGPI